MGRPRWLRFRSERGAVEVGVAVAAGALVLGVVAGNGMVSTALSVAADSIWLPQPDTGQVTELDPATGQLNQRLDVTDPGAMRLVQRDGFLFVRGAGGDVSSIDLASLLRSGRTQLDEDHDVRVLAGGGLVVLANLTEGLLRVVDPVTLADRGRAYRAELTDATIDRAGTVWAVEAAAVVELRWSVADRRLTIRDRHRIGGVGAHTRLVPHQRGVTVFAPDGDAVVQLGTDRVLAASVDLADGVVPAEYAPDDLVPASMPKAGAVALVSRSEVIRVDVRPLACPRPGAPAVLGDRVYVPCGSGRVIVLGRDGKQAAKPLVVAGGGEVTLVADAGHLVVLAGNGRAALVVSRDGSVRAVGIAGAGSKSGGSGSGGSGSGGSGSGGSGGSSTAPGGGISAGPVRPGGTATTRPPGPGGKTPGEPGPTRPGGASTTPPVAPPVAPPVTPPVAPPVTHGAPGDVAATRTSATEIASTWRVTWTAAKPAPAKYIVSATGAADVTVGGTVGAATLPGVPCGTAPLVTVIAVYADGFRGNANTEITTPACRPTPATDVFAKAVNPRKEGDTWYRDVELTWTAPTSGADSLVVKHIWRGAVWEEFEIAGNKTRHVFLRDRIVDNPHEGDDTFQIVTKLNGQEVTSAGMNLTSCDPICP